MPSRPVHPGEILADELAELGITPIELARRLRVQGKCVTEIMEEKQDLTSDMAMRLGHWFGTSREFWINLQRLHDSALAEWQAVPLFQPGTLHLAGSPA